MIQEEVVRRERLARLKEAKINPYPSSATRSHMANDVLHQFEKLESSKTIVDLSGRILSIRRHGGLTFATLKDESGTIQIALHRDVIGEEKYEFFHAHADMGDFFSISGIAFRTKRGEPSVDTQSYTLLSKALLPLPEKWHGLTDTEKRYRQRYLDLLSNESVMHAAKSRSRMVQSIRAFLEKNGYMEVETPVLQPIAGGATAKPFITHHNTLQHDFYLRIAPELYLKRLMVGGFERIYEFARCFRNEGVSPQHNPEFTQIELYSAYSTIEDLMDHLERMMQEVVPATVGDLNVTYRGHFLSFASPLPRMTFHDAILTHAGIDLDLYTSEEAIIAEMEKRHIATKGIIGYGELVDHLWKTSARPKIIQPTFITDYPVAMKPLAKQRENNPEYSASAQLVIHGMEVWNAFNELNDPIEQEMRFKEQEGLRERGSEDAQRIDEDFLTALKHGMPPTAGYGLGIDRLAMILTDSPNLKEVILFPTLKPEVVNEPEQNEAE